LTYSIVLFLKQSSKFHDVFDNIYTAIVKLPKPIRRVCFVQVFAFMGWCAFSPFVLIVLLISLILLGFRSCSMRKAIYLTVLRHVVMVNFPYRTTYVGQVMAYEHQEEPDSDVATRTGEFAMLIYSIGRCFTLKLYQIYLTFPTVAVVAGTVLPHLASRDRRLLAHKGDVNEDAELTRIRNTVREWRAEAMRRGTPLRLPVMPFLLRNIWTGALLLFTLLTFSTLFISTVFQVRRLC
jgi:solute carrier family 45 protein 1/2/4